MNIERTAFDTDEARNDERARRDVAEGRTVSHEDVAAWLRRKIADPSLPMPSEWPR